MKKVLLLSIGLLSGGLSLAQELGRVVSSMPVIQQFSVPRQVCTTEQVMVQQPKSGAGALMGAIAGGAMGNAVGGGNGKTAATVLGIIGGAVVGDNIEGAAPTQTQNVQRCRMQTFYENRTVAYNVNYEFSGKQYSVQMPYDPGPTIQLQITPVISSPPIAPSVPVIYPQR
ncbi:MAG: glycine zipper 2TM domain-containing protein [Rhodoferax sp.]